MVTAGPQNQPPGVRVPVQTGRPGFSFETDRAPDVTFGFFASGRVGGRVFETHAQWAGGRRFRIFQWAEWVGVQFLSSKTGWAGVGARARPALSEVLRGVHLVSDV